LRSSTPSLKIQQATAVSDLRTIAFLPKAILRKALAELPHAPARNRFAAAAPVPREPAGAIFRV